MLISQAFPSKYLKASDLADRHVPVIIESITIEEIDDDDGKSIQKPVLYFKGKDKGLCLNKTNANAIAAVYGEETDDWMGRPIILYARMVDFKGNEVLGIRVQIQQPAMREMRVVNGPSVTPMPPPVRPVTVHRATVTAELNDDIPF